MIGSKTFVEGLPLDGIMRRAYLEISIRRVPKMSCICTCIKIFMTKHQPANKSNTLNIGTLLE